MTFDLLGDVNWLAVVLGGLAYFVIGALWYSPPVFGNIWAAAGGMDTSAEGPRAAVYVVPLVGSLLSAIALGMIAEATATDTVGEGIVLGVVAGIGFAAAVVMVTAIFESSKPNPMRWGAVTAGYHLVGNIAAAIIIAAMS